MKIIALLPLPILLLAGCGDTASDTKTVTKLDAVEVQPGTISDSMIVLDDSAVDGTAVDNSVPADPSAKSPDKTDDDADKPADAEDSETSDAPESATPATKTSEPKGN